MKKLLFYILSLFVLMSVTTVCYAGDIPETLLGDNSAQVFFGEIKNVDEEIITVIQRQNIKGEFSKDSEITYNSFSFTASPKLGEIYLCGYVDENNPLYVWEVTSTETKSLQISNTDEMSKRMQQYLNEGRFEEKESERLAAASGSEAPSQVPTATDGTNTTNPTAKADNNYIFALIVVGVILVRVLFLLAARKKK